MGRRGSSTLESEKVESQKRKLLSITPQNKQQKRQFNSNIREKYDLDNSKCPTLSLKDRRSLAESMTSYMNVEPPEQKTTPGYDIPMTIYERIREGMFEFTL